MCGADRCFLYRYTHYDDAAYGVLLARQHEMLCYYREFAVLTLLVSKN